MAKVRNISKDDNSIGQSTSMDTALCIFFDAPELIDGNSVSITVPDKKYDILLHDVTRDVQDYLRGHVNEEVDALLKTQPLTKNDINNYEFSVSLSDIKKHLSSNKNNSLNSQIKNSLAALKACTATIVNAEESRTSITGFYTKFDIDEKNDTVTFVLSDMGIDLWCSQITGNMKRNRGFNLSSLMPAHRQLREVILNITFMHPEFETDPDFKYYFPWKNIAALFGFDYEEKDDFAYFNRVYLKKARDAISQNTDISFDYKNVPLEGTRKIGGINIVNIKRDYTKIPWEKNAENLQNSSSALLPYKTIIVEQNDFYNYAESLGFRREEAAFLFVLLKGEKEQLLFYHNQYEALFDSGFSMKEFDFIKNSFKNK